MSPGWDNDKLISDRMWARLAMWFAGVCMAGALLAFAILVGSL